MTQHWNVEVDRTACIGSGICVGTAPGRFVLGEDQRSRAVDELIDPDEAVRDAAASCPVEAISVADAATGALVELD
jgi:ferredoxin